MLDRHSYDWLTPPPQSKQITAQPNSAPLATTVGTITIVQYTVSEGMRFSLRGVTLGCTDPNGVWDRGGTQLVFTLQARGAGGVRPVEWFANLSLPVGSLEQPFPIIGKCEFEENTILEVVCVSDGTVTQGRLFAIIMGFERPNVPCDDGGIRQ